MRRYGSELAYFLNLYWHVECGGPHLAAEFADALEKLKHPSRAQRFKRELAQAIMSRSVTTMDLERWTLLCLDDNLEVHEELQEVWRSLYGTESPAEFLEQDGQVGC